MKRVNKKPKAIIAILLVCVILVGGLGFLTSGFRNWNVKDWLSNGEQLPTITDGDDKDMSDPDKVYPMSERMIFASAPANTQSPATVTVKATVYPDYATDKSVNWAIDWVNATSTWATGKSVTAYATVTPQAAGSTTATITCLQAFGEPIKVVVTSNNNVTAKAESQLDYAKRLLRTNYGATMQDNSIFDFNSSSKNFNFPTLLQSNTCIAHGTLPLKLLEKASTFTYDYSVGTVDNTITQNNVKFELSTGYISAAKAKGLAPTEKIQNMSSFSWESLITNLSTSIIGTGFECSVCDEWTRFWNVAEQNKIIQALQATNGTVFTLTATSTAKYGGETISTVNVSFSAGSLTFAVESVAVDTGEILF